MTELAGQDQPTWNFPSVGRWGVSALPQGWIFMANFGIRQITPDERQVAANISLSEDILPDQDGLPAYIDAQVKLIESHLEGAKIAGPQVSIFPNADQSYLLMVRHSPEGAVDMLHVQSYIRLGLWLGIVTLTTVESQLREVRPQYDAFVKGLRILPPSRSSSGVQQ